MNIAIIGTGNYAQALGKRLQQAKIGAYYGK
jgi:predicted dinucleotide-binding enzyme